MKIQKTICKIIYNFILIISLMAAGIFTGLYIAQDAAEKEAKKLTIDTIAVVNMDEGVTIDNTYINYASELMKYPDVNFISTGLEEARQGVQTGSYAAYIIIPVGFSESVVSLNMNMMPESTSLEYALNPDLRDDIYTLVMADINVFTQNLNDNIEYMYLNSILEEFHTAQDSAQQIMINDTQDMDLLLAVDHEDLEHRISLTPVEMPEYDLSSLELSTYYESNKALASEIAQLYETYEQNGEQAFSEIMQQGEAIGTGLSDVKNVIENADFSVDAGGNNIISSGKQCVDEYIALVELQNADTMQCIEEGISSYQGLVTEGMTQLLKDEVIEGFSQDVNEYYAELLEELQADIEELDEIQALLSSAAATERSGYSLSEPETENENESERGNSPDIPARLQEISEHIEELKENIYVIEEAEIEEISRQVAEDTTADMQSIIEAMNSIEYVDTNEMSVLVETSVLEPLENNQLRIEDDINTVWSDVNAKMTAYHNDVMQFHMYDYVNSGEINKLLTNLSTNMTTMQSEIQTQDAEYRQLVYDIYASENENLQNWQTDILEADELSAQRLEQGLEEAKLSRDNSNSNNVEMLYALTQKLPYTRKGSMEFISAYEFIVSPVTTANVGGQQNITLFHSDKDYEVYIICLGIFIGCVLLSKMGYYVLYRQRELGEDSEEEHKVHINKKQRTIKKIADKRRNCNGRKSWRITG